MRTFYIITGLLLLLITMSFNIRPVASEAGQTYPFFAIRAHAITVLFAAASALLLWKRKWFSLWLVILILAFGVRYLTFYVLKY